MSKTFNKTKLDLGQLRKEIREMTIRKKLYRVLKEELTQMGYWKNLKRGKPNPMFVRRP